MSPSWRNNPVVASWPGHLGRWYAGARAVFGRSIAMPWQRDELCIALFPDRLIMARVRCGWRPQIKHKEILTFTPALPDAPRWRPALEALAEKVRSGALAGADVTLVLSNHFVNYALVPWSELLSGEDEQLAFARHRFTRVYGDAAANWALRLSRTGPRQPRLACAVEPTLIDALNNAMEPLDSRYCSLQPHLMVSFNRWRARLGARQGWFVVAEAGLLCIVLLQSGQWHSVRTIKCGTDWACELPGLLARERCLVEAHAECDQVAVFAPGQSIVAALTSPEWKFEELRPTLLPDMAPGVDAQFAIAVGV